jgi:hypothetical protein
MKIFKLLSLASLIAALTTGVAAAAETAVGDDTPDSVDCFYDANKNHPACQ